MTSYERKGDTQFTWRIHLNICVSAKHSSSRWYNYDSVLSREVWWDKRIFLKEKPIYVKGLIFSFFKLWLIHQSHTWDRHQTDYKPNRENCITTNGPKSVGLASVWIRFGSVTEVLVKPPKPTTLHRLIRSFQFGLMKFIFVRSVVGLIMYTWGIITVTPDIIMRGRGGAIGAQVLSGEWSSLRGLFNAGCWKGSGHLLFLFS